MLYFYYTILLNFEELLSQQLKSLNRDTVWWLYRFAHGHRLSVVRLAWVINQR
jgi:hypothetical protein